jgi:hypothetical protein
MQDKLRQRQNSVREEKELVSITHVMEKQKQMRLHHSEQHRWRKFQYTLPYKLKKVVEEIEDRCSKFAQFNASLFT